MQTVKLPYGRGTVEVKIPKNRLLGVLESKAHNFKPDSTQEELVQSALDNPVNSQTLRELMKDKENVVIISSDHTRPVPSKVTMPILLQEIRKGNPQAKITILIATGFHRLTTREELIDKYGEKVVAEENIVIHDSTDENSLLHLGTLPSGGPLWINRAAVETDLLIAEGFIEPHFFAGFSGGRKSVLPGIAGRDTVLANHCAEFISSPFSRTGNLNENPLHVDMLWAGKQAKLAFILNVVIDSEKRVIAAFAGHSEDAHIEGCKFVEELAAVKAAPADIVITSNGGYPLDQNIYQAVKGMTAAEATCKQGGVIIILAAINDGHGGEEFYHWLADAPCVTHVTKKILAIPRHETIPDQWEAQVLARVLEKYKVILVTAEGDPKLVTDMHMMHASSAEEALKMAEEIMGSDSSITVVPDGVSVIVQS